MGLFGAIPVMLGIDIGKEGYGTWSYTRCEHRKVRKCPEGNADFDLVCDLVEITMYKVSASSEGEWCNTSQCMPPCKPGTATLPGFPHV